MNHLKIVTYGMEDVELEPLQNSGSKMAASATTNGISHISVISLHGSVAGWGSCCTGFVTSHGWRGRSGQLWWKGVSLRRMEL